MKKFFSRISSTYKNLAFSITEVFKANPFCFIINLVIELFTTVSYFALLYFGKMIINTMSFSLENNLSIEESVSNVAMWLILAAILSLTLVFLGYFGNLLSQKQQLFFDEYINMNMAKKCMSLDISYFDTPEYHYKIERARNGRVRLGFIIYRAIIFIMNSLSLIIALFIALSVSHAVFVILILISTVPVLLTTGMYYKKEFEYENSSQTLKRFRKICYLEGLITGKATAKEVRFYNMDKFICDEFTDNWNAYDSGRRKIIVKTGLIDAIFSVLPFVAIFFSLYFVVLNIIDGTAQIGDLTYILAVYLTLSRSLFNIIEDLGKFGESVYSIQKYTELMEAKPNISYDGSLEITEVKTIEFKNVCFTYPSSSEIVLSDVNFFINATEKTAIIGINGAGKTTIVKLLLRFYDVDSGEILLNGVNIKEYDIASLRKTFSAVFQDFVIYSLSIRDNISFSNYSQRNEDQKIMQALEFAEIKENIFSKTDSLDTFLSRDFYDDGIELSGGQKQKIAIARSAFSDAHILIMDEPTASLDPQAEHAIISKLNTLYEGKGLIFISHRLSNMRSMDSILVIDHGKIIENGCHEKLMQNKGLYNKLYTLQAEKYTTEDAIV